jgi:arylsulfatase A-like enzyme
MNFTGKNTKKIVTVLFVSIASFFSLGLAASEAGGPGKASLPGKSAQEKPNIVFLLSEDNSRHFMDLFDPAGVKTPHIRALAKEGVVFQHAFSNSPVCSVARSTLITGTLATRTGMHLHRKIQLAPLPEGLDMFPTYLRRAGYYTTNNSKKDYNAVENQGVWDESSNDASWNKRKDKNQPFFHQETFMGSHESKLHFPKSLMQEYQPQDDPGQVAVFPFFPGTPTFRFTTAYHRDKIRDVDAWVGKVLGQLEADGLLDDTFVFYFGDHGGVLPGSKGYLYETGLHVPLVVRVPQNWQHLAGYDKGATATGFVSFIDFAPTALQLAGLPVPAQMDGKPFLGPGLRAEVEARDETLGYADRFDEKYDMVRSLRKGNWKYLRSYQPFYPDGLHNNYRYQMLAFAEWRELFRQGKLDPLQARFFLPKPVEMLFDLEKDPLELDNLAGQPQHRQTLLGLRTRLNEKLLASNDLGFLPESMLLDQAMGNPVKYGEHYHQQLAEILRLNDLAFVPFKKANKELQQVLQKGTALEKYWALNLASGFGEEAASLSPRVAKLTGDHSKVVRLKAIEFLGIAGKQNPLPPLVELINGTDNPVEALQMLNTLVYFKDHSSYPFSVEIAQIQPKKSNEEVQRRMDYLKGNW